MRPCFRDTFKRHIGNGELPPKQAKLVATEVFSILGWLFVQGSTVHLHETAIDCLCLCVHVLILVTYISLAVMKVFFLLIWVKSIVVHFIIEIVAEFTRHWVNNVRINLSRISQIEY